MFGSLCGPWGTTQAQTPKIISKINAEDLAALLLKIGFTAGVVDDNGEKVVYPAGFFMGSGTPEVRLQNCSPEGCGRLVFKIATGMRAAKDFEGNWGWVNNWNQKIPFGLVKAYVSADNTLHLDMTVDLTGGVSSRFIEQSAYAFVTCVNRIYRGTGLD